MIASVIANFELALKRSILTHHDEARLGAALFEDAAQEDLRGPLVVLLGEEELRDLEQLLVEHSACLQSVTSASGNRHSLTDLGGEVLNGGER